MIRKGARNQRFEFPLKGENQAWAQNAQPRGTSPRLLNVMPFDPDQKRARGGVRGGTIQKAQLGDGARPIQCLLQATLIATQASLYPDTAWYPLDSWWTVNGPSCENPGDTDPPLSGDTMEVTGGRIQTSGAATAAGVFHNGIGPAAPGLFEQTPAGWFRAGADDNQQRCAIFTTDVDPGACWQVIVHPTFAAEPPGLPDSPDQGVRLLVNVRLDANQRPMHGQGELTLVVSDNQWWLYRTTISGDELVANGNRNNLGSWAITLECVKYADGRVEFKQFGQLLHSFPAGSYDQLRPIFGFGWGKSVGTQVGGQRSSISLLEVDKSAEEPGDRQVKLVAVCNGGIYLGKPDALTLAIDGEGALDPRTTVSAAALLGKVYFVDGRAAVKVLDLATGSVSTLSATAGAVPQRARIVCVYRERLCFAGIEGDEHNIVCSRAGNPHDYDFGAEDSQGAVDFNATSTAGQIGQPVHALAPFRDDTLVIFADHSMYRLAGDPHPLAGGSLDTISDLVGILGRDAWCYDSGGSLYFLGTGAFYRYSGQGEPEDLSSDTVPESFGGLSRGSEFYLSLAWDRDRKGCWLFNTPRQAYKDAAHYWFDARMQGFFPMRFPRDHGPWCCLVYDGDDPADRKLLLGGRQGKLLEVSEAYSSDNGAAIRSEVVLGPIDAGGPYSEAGLLSLSAVLGEPTAGLSYALWTGKDAADALSGTHVALWGTWNSGGSQPRLNTRARGHTLLLYLSCDQLDARWSIESIDAELVYGGPAR